MMTISTVTTAGIYFKKNLSVTAGMSFRTKLMNEMYAALIFWGLCWILIWATTPTPI
jgi:hypothetical protein